MNNFDSLDKLMELGLSMVVAQQMMGTMNNALNNMQVGQAVPTVKMHYYAVIDSAQAGPFPEEELVQLVAAGKLTGETLVWKAGLPAWVRAQEVSEVNKLLVLNSIKTEE
ncbi:GYF domain-containing protein [Alistipes sp. OttesenSCG-928-B03]|nr:GYF domain-containing protein [Alistipes sp. OttesenSCG-928-B03]